MSLKQWLTLSAAGNRPGSLPVATLLGITLTLGCSTAVIDANRSIIAVSEPTPLMQRAGAGDLDGVDELVAAGDPLNARSPQSTALMEAAAGGHDDVVWYLLRQGAAPDLASADGITPLMIAARQGEDRVAKMLLQAGARVNTVSVEGDTALAWAAREGYLSTVKLLLGEGANVNVMRNGQSLLMQVVGQENLLMSQVLLDAGADVHFQNDHGQSALGMARQRQNRDLEMLLVQSGARL